MPTDPHSADFTWPALLAHWTDFARASLALPKTGEGDRWRAAVPAIIGLQAVAFALGDLDCLAPRPGDPAGERALALDRADMIIRRHAAELHELWRGEPLHTELAVLIEDARAAFAAAKEGGVEWRTTDARTVAEHPAELVGALIGAGFIGDLMLPAPGYTLFKGSPAAFARDPLGATPDAAVLNAIADFLGAVGEPSRVNGPRQVYRQFDFAKGGPVRDVVVPMDATLPAGQPLLVHAIQGGAAQPVSLPPRRLDELPDLPVIFECPGEDRPGM